MTETEEPRYNIDAVLATIRTEYPSHASLPPDARIKNDIATNLSLVMSPADLWKVKGVPETVIDDLYKRGFSKINQLYSSDKGKKLLKEVINDSIEYEKERAEQREKETGVKPVLAKAMLFEKYKTELGIAE